MTASRATQLQSQPAPRRAARPCSRVAVVASLLVVTALAMPVGAAEPTAAELWAKPTVPFCVTAPARAISDLSPVREYSYRNGLSVEENSSFRVPHEKVTVDVENRTRALQDAASHIAGYFAKKGFRPPRLHVENGCFRALLVKDPGNAAAFYAQGLEDSVDDDDQYERWNIARRNGVEPPYYLFINELSAFGQEFSNGVYPEAGLISMAHEMFHAIQAVYPQPTTRSEAAGRSRHERKWVVEGLPDAIAVAATRGIRFLGNPPFFIERRVASGNRKYGKLLGLRMYDYPLSLSELPPAMKSTGSIGMSPRQVEELASYMSSSFWRFVFHDSIAAGSEWALLPEAMAIPVPNRAKLQGLKTQTVAWADDTIKAVHPAWTRGLYDALPAFIAHHVESPDQQYRGPQRLAGRRGVFKHPLWLEYVFEDGCPKLELNEQNPTATIVTRIRPLAATCVRVKWTGKMHPKSGSPAAAAVATLVTAARKENLEALHLGLGGRRAGRKPSYTDLKSGKRVLSWINLDLDPLNPGRTDGETVLTFINVARDALKSEELDFEIKLGVGYTVTEGRLQKPAEPDAVPPRPASSGKAGGAPTARPAMDVGGEELDFGLTDPGNGISGADDCTNYALKQLMGSMTGTSIQRNREKEIDPTPLQACGELAKLADPARALAALGATSGKLNVSLNLPRIASGAVGGVRGAELRASWYDEALQKLTGGGDVSATTDLVNVNIAEANEAFIRGAYSGRFDFDLHGISGTLSGEFLIWRSDTEEYPEPDDPLDLLSSDWLLAASYTGIDMISMVKQAAAQQVTGGASGAGSSGYSGAGGSGGTAATTACSCDCAEFAALRRPVSPTRQACAVECGNFPSSALCTIEQAVGSGTPRAEVMQQANACPTACADLREGKISEFCKDFAWNILQGCSATGAVTDAELVSLVAWYTRDYPEPQGTELRASLMKELRGGDVEARERWAVAIREARRQEEAQP